MSIRVITNKPNRFGKLIQIKNEQVLVDKTGIAEISENLVIYALEAGFELEDQNVQFSSKEEQEKVLHVNEIIDQAKIQAGAIIEKAHLESEKIIEEARKKAGLILQDGHVEEKEQARKNLNDKSVKEIKDVLASSGVDENEYKNLKKEELIELALRISFE